MGKDRMVKRLRKQRYMIWYVIGFVMSICLVACDKKGNPQGTEEPDLSDSTQVTNYTNPVFEPILADPSVIKADDGWFYAYGTEDNWGDGQGSRLVPIVRSKDLVKWKYTGTAFGSKPTWKPSGGGIWAPDVVKVNGKYYMYYSFSVWADPDPGVGLAIADSPAGPFIDQGKLFLSSEAGIANGIDPFYIEEDGKKYLFCGSYSNAATQGIHAFELSNDGLSVKDLSAKIKISAGDFEAVMIHKRNGYYYFFASKGGCCDGAASTYHVCVARSTSLLGPYLDKTGNPVTSRGTGTLLIQGNNTYAGPGHNAQIITDKAGTDWFIYHAIKKSNPKVSSGASRRSLMIDKLTWSADGWPDIKGQSPSLNQQSAPVF